MIELVRVVTAASPSTAALEAEFPTVSFVRANAAERGDVVVDAGAWARAPRFDPFDAALEAAPDARAVAVVASISSSALGADVVRATGEILTRWQRRIARRNEASRAPIFASVLAAHRAMHRLDLPLVEADHDHALDTWQWMLRLEPDVPLAPQLAALFHDVERLETEAERRVEHRASDYQAFKDAHAARGADAAYDALRSVHVPEGIAARARAIIASHEQRGLDRDVDLLNDADALSFFSLNSSGYLDYFGVEQTRRKVAWTLRRLGQRARPKLALAKLRADVERLVQEAEGR